jgi:hypothetical protein
VTLYRPLATSHPDIHIPDLARLLNAWSLHSVGLDQEMDALTLIEESVSLFRSLSAIRPEPFAVELALSLNTHSPQLTSLGRDDEARTHRQPRPAQNPLRTRAARFGS